MTADVSHIGRYSVESVLGRGAMGVVYRAHDPDIDRAVAIKLIRADLLDGEDRANYVARFRREAQAAARCMHPNVVTIFDFATHEGNPFLAMEFIDGVSLARARPRGTRLGADDAAFLILQVLDALGAAHAMGVVHRDIKPANILLVGGNRVKVTDFGISRLENAGLTQAGEAIGTPSYMSPEQCRGDPVDARSDLFSAGAVLYEMLAGDRPFAGPTITEVMQKLLHDPPPDLATRGVMISPALQGVLDRALAKAPQDRFTSAAEMAAALRQAVATDTAPEDRTIILPVASAPASTTPGPGSATGSTATGGFDRELLGTLERKLAQYVGPIAHYLVQNAVRDADNPETLLATLAGNIENPADRASFRAAAAQLRAPTLSMTSLGIGPAERETAEKALAHFIGPVARVLVKRESTRAVSVSDLWQRLAAHIEKESDRTDFLRRRS